MVAKLLGQENCLEVWVAYFESLQAEKVGASLHSASRSTGMKSQWEEVKLPTLEELRKASLSFKTPKKLRLGNVLAPDTVPVMGQARGDVLGTFVDQDIDNNDIIEKTNVKRAHQIIMADCNKLNSNFEMIYLEFDTSGRAKTKYRNSVSDMHGKIQMTIR
jgi:hypothetical protein